jgi:hypothetical protein
LEGTGPQQSDPSLACGASRAFLRPQAALLRELGGLRLLISERTDEPWVQGRNATTRFPTKSTILRRDENTSGLHVVPVRVFLE